MADSIIMSTPTPSETIHANCNRCWTKLYLFQIDPRIGREARNYVTGCQHLLCQKCISTDRARCCVCQSRLRYLKIDKNMPSHIRMCFLPMPKLWRFLERVRQFQTIQNGLCIKRLVARKLEYARRCEAKKKLRRQYKMKHWQLLKASG